MATVETIKEALRLYGIRPDNIDYLRILQEEGGESVEVSLKSGKREIIKDPAIVFLAKYSTLDWEEEHRNYVLRTLYAVDKVFCSCNKTFLEWVKNYENKPLENLKTELVSLGERFGINENFKGYLIIDITKKLTEMATYVPAHIDTELNKLPTYTLIDMLVDLDNLKAQNKVITDYDFHPSEIVLYCLPRIVDEYTESF